MNVDYSSPRRLPNDPLRVLFVLTSMPIGGAETLLVNLVRRIDRTKLSPEICCLKEPGPLGELLAREVPLQSHLLSHKYDLRVFLRLRHLMRSRQIDAVVTVGAGDKMFWGRLAARSAGVPVVLSALHSTGWPDGVGRLNRALTGLTDRFIAVADEHGRYLVEEEKFPRQKVHIIPNGVDTDRFRPRGEVRKALRSQLSVPEQTPVFGIVAALRPEKNHLLFIRAASLIHGTLPDVRFWIVGQGPQQPAISAAIRSAGLQDHVTLLGARWDIPEILAAIDGFVLTSHNEANPVSILEAMAVGLPVVSTRVGSVPEMVREGLTGFLADPGDARRIAQRCVYLATHGHVARRLGQQGRALVVGNWSLDRMVRGYQQLVMELYQARRGDIERRVGCVPSSEDLPNISIAGIGSVEGAEGADIHVVG